MAKKKPAKRGRPKGSKTKPKPIQTVAASRCQKCQSTERTMYSSSRPPLVYSGFSPTGEPFTSVHWRCCKCKSCGQSRVDKEYRYEIKSETE